MVNRKLLCFFGFHQWLNLKYLGGIGHICKFCQTLKRESICYLQKCIGRCTCGSYKVVMREARYNQKKDYEEKRIWMNAYPEWYYNLTWDWISRWLLNGAVMFGIIIGFFIGWAFGERMREKWNRTLKTGQHGSFSTWSGFFLAWLLPQSSLEL